MESSDYIAISAVVVAGISLAISISSIIQSGKHARRTAFTKLNINNFSREQNNTNEVVVSVVNRGTGVALIEGVDYYYGERRLYIGNAVELRDKIKEAVGKFNFNVGGNYIPVGEALGIGETVELVVFRSTQSEEYVTSLMSHLRIDVRYKSVYEEHDTATFGSKNG